MKQRSCQTFRVTVRFRNYHLLQKPEIIFLDGFNYSKSFSFMADNVKLPTIVTIPEYLFDYKTENRWRYISKNGVARFTYRQLYGIRTKTPIFRNIEQIHRTGFPTHFFCSSLKFGTGENRSVWLLMMS